MPRSGGKIEKSKDFKGSMIKLFKSIKKWEENVHNTYYSDTLFPTTPRGSISVKKK